MIHLRQFLGFPVNHGDLARTIGGVGSLQIVGLVVTFFVGIQLARLLGVTGYGDYGIALAVISLASVPGELALARLVLRETAAAVAENNAAKQRAVVSWSSAKCLQASALTMILLAVVLLALESSISPSVRFAILTGLPLIPLNGLLAINASALSGLQKIVLAQVPALVVRPLLLSLLLLALAHLPVKATATGAMMVSVIACLAALILVKAWLRGDLTKRDSSYPVPADEWFQSARHIALMDGIRLTQGQLSLILLGILAGSEAAGHFRVAMSIALMVATPMTMFETVAGPNFARHHAAGESNEIQLISRHMARSGLIILALICLPLILFGRPILTLLFGAEFLGAYAPLIVLCVSQLFNAFWGLNAVLLIMTGSERHLTKFVFLGFVGNFVAVVALAPTLGAVGAAIGSLVYMIVWNVLAWKFAKRNLQINTAAY